MSFGSAGSLGPLGVFFLLWKDSLSQPRQCLIKQLLGRCCIVLVGHTAGRLSQEVRLVPTIDWMLFEEGCCDGTKRFEWDWKLVFSPLVSDEVFQLLVVALDP